MAHKMMKNGYLVWWPDQVNIGHKKMLIDPNAAPLDEVWRFLHTIVSIFLTGYKAWAKTKDDMEELEQMCYAAAYYRLRMIVLRGLYRRDLSFYLNCRSAVLATCFNTYNVWLRDMRRKNDLVCGDDPVLDDEHCMTTYFDMRSAEEVPKLITDSEYRGKDKITDWREAQTPAAKTRIANETAEDEYSRYCENCLEMGVEPIDKIAFITQNFDEESQEVMKRETCNSQYVYQARYRRLHKTDPEWRKKQQDYQHMYYALHKEQILAKRKKRS